jgi:PAS domain-containing protein
MTRNLPAVQLTIILGGILLLAGFLVLLVFAMHRFTQRQRKGGDLSPGKLRPGDSTAFATAALQGVVAGLKAREKELNEMLRQAERRAETSSRTLEILVRDSPSGLMIFDRAGFLTLSNPAVRSLLGIDTWSRRRYTEILGAESMLAGILRECLETGRNCRDRAVSVPAPQGGTRTLSVSVSPWQGRSGQVEGVVCFLAKRQ